MQPEISFLQRLRRYIRWTVAPLIYLVIMLLILLWLMVVVWTRISLSFLERGEAFCPPPVPHAALTAPIPFETGRPCNSTGLVVREGQRYLVRMDVERGWVDGVFPADPRGLAARDIGLAGYVGAPLRRAVGARYLQPVAHIGGSWTGPAIQPLELERNGGTGAWYGEFVAERSGPLSFFANESVLPWAPTYFYAQAPYANAGTARMTIVPAR